MRMRRVRARVELEREERAPPGALLPARLRADLGRPAADALEPQAGPACPVLPRPGKAAAVVLDAQPEAPSGALQRSETRDPAEWRAALWTTPAPQGTRAAARPATADLRLGGGSAVSSVIPCAVTSGVARATSLAPQGLQRSGTRPQRPHDVPQGRGQLVGDLRDPDRHGGARGLGRRLADGETGEDPMLPRPEPMASCRSMAICVRCRSSRRRARRATGSRRSARRPLPSASRP